MKNISSLTIQYKKIPIQVKASIAFVVCNILQKAISLITTPLYTRMLTTAQYGQFSLFSTWYSLLEIFATLNLFNAAFNNGMVKYKNDKSVFVSSMQGLSTVSTIIVMLVIFCGWNFWKNIIDLPLFVVALIFLQLLFYPAFMFWSAEQRYQYKYKLLVFFTLLCSVMVPTISCLAIKLNRYPEYNGYIRIVTSAAVFIAIGLSFYIYNAVQGKKFFVKNYWKFAIIFSVPLIPHYLSNIILGQIDTVMISKYFGGSEVAIYSLSNQISLIMNFVNAAIWSSLTPTIYQKIDAGKENTIKSLASKLTGLMCLITLIPAIAAPEAIRILGTEEYMDGVWLIAPVTMTILFRFVYGFYSTVEFYYGYSFYSTIASIVGAIVDVVLDAILIPLYGYRYAGYTTFLCYFLMMVLHYFFMKAVLRKEKKNIHLYDNKKIILIVAVGCIFSLGFMGMYSTIFPRLLLGGIMEIVLATLLIYNMKKEQNGAGNNE